MLQKKILSLSIALAVGAVANYGYAQSESAGVVEEVLVRGVKSSVAGAIAVKQEAQQIVDSIVSEDIGKLPDNSVAAALQRVTGVQITRLNGEASGVMVRGLPNVVTTLNGRNIFTTTGRGISMADIPADLLQRVDVKKSSSADDLEGGIAGLVDVRLRRPFDFDEGLTVAGAIRGEYSDRAEKTDPAGSLTVNNTWNTGAGEFGAMFSLSYQDRRFMDQVNFNTAPGAEIINHPLSVANPAGTAESLIPGVIGSYYRYGDRNRTSGNLALQWRPNDSAEYYFEGFMVDYDQDSEMNFWVPLPSWGGFDGYVTEYKPGTNVVKSFVRDNAPGTISSNQAFANASKTSQFAIGGKWDLSSTVRLSSDLAYTKSEANSRGFILDLVFFAPQVAYDFSKNNSGVSDVTITNADGSPFDLSNPDHYLLNQFFDQRSQQEGDEVSWNADATFELADTGITSLDIGARTSWRTAFNQEADTGGRPNISGRDVRMTEFPGMESMTPNNFLEGVASLNTKQWLTPSRDYIYANRVDIRQTMGYGPEDPSFIPARFFDNDEDSYAVYAKANYALELAGMPLDGQFGVRVLRLDSSLSGINIIDGSIEEPITISSSDNKVLPSLSARLGLRDDLFLRFAYGETISRPGFADLNPATAYFQPTPTMPDNGTGTGGNPSLKAIESSSFDVSLEWYFSDVSSLTGTLFYRDIDGYIQFYAAEEMRDGVPYRVTRPQNTGSGSLEGVELAYTHFFDFLPGIWSGFGVQLNGTYIDGEALSPTGVMQPLQNVSDKSYNAVLLYEYNKLSARLAYNWRSEYYGSFNEGGAQPGKSLVVKDSDSLDLSVSYDINDNLTLSFDATNLTDSVYGDYFGGHSSADAYLYPRDTYARDKTYAVGVRFRY